MIADEIQFLQNSLLYQMSLGSKELYHSNVWAWLIKQDHAFIKVFFPDFDENIYEITEIERECRHRDLIIWLHKKGFLEKEEKYFYVIENKIKSLQSRNQLQDYTEDLWDNKMLGGIVTGIANALESDSEEITGKNNVKIIWKFVRYDKIATEIQNIAINSQKPVIREKLCQIIEYFSIINSVYKIVNFAVNRNKQVLDYACDDSLHKVGLKDVFVKLKGADFMHYAQLTIKSQLEELCPEGYNLFIGQSFHNGRATLDFRFSNWEQNCKDWLTIGIQLEGSQYRYLVERGEKHNKDEIFEKFKGVWFDGNFNPSEFKRTLFGKDTSMKKLFDSYGDSSGEYIFVYQYYNVSNQAYDNLLKNITKDLQTAKEIIERGIFS